MKWQSFRYDFGTYLKSDSIIKAALLEFLQQVVKPLQGNNTICFMFKIQTDQGFRSITHLQQFNINKTPYPIKGLAIEDFEGQLKLDQQNNLSTFLT